MKNAYQRFISFLLCLVMVLCLIPSLQITANAETGYDRGYDGKMAGNGKIYAHGLDVSAWQETGLNFQNFADAGYDYVILRCGTTKGKDVCFEEYYASAKKAGLDVGCYYYSYATSVAAAEADARNMLSWMGDKVFEYPIYFDYEDASQDGIDGTTAAKICYAFMDILKDNGYLVGLYSMESWLERSWITSSGIRDTYEGWVANVPSVEANSGITSNLYMINHDKFCNRYGMYQYSFDTYVNGQGPFDANVCYKDYPSIVKEYGFNGYAQQETWIEKAAFDTMVYRDRNPDLADMTNAQLKEHWLEHGIKEGRASSPILDLGFYLNNNPDLKEAYGNDYEKVYNHFITKGYKEYRKSSALFDGSYYCNRYPEVKESYKEEYLRHYVENGMAEGRRASLTYDPNYYWFIRPDVAEAWPGDYEMAAKHYAGHGINAQIEAYDHEYPVIKDAVISDVSAAGYTVTCTVTDNWALSKVAFPTWTLANDQDDLAADFMNTQKGTKNGNTYTFRVNASDHNNETGKYVTHIYALDKGGNRIRIVLDVVTVEDPVQTVVPTVAGKSFSLSFEDEILVNFYYTVSDMTSVTEHGMLMFKNQPATVTVEGADAVYSAPTYVAAADMYLTTTDSIAAKEMGDSRYYAAYAKLTDGSIVYSGAYEYSPKKYAMNMLGKSSTSDKQKALCVAMLNYGAAAQKYFGYTTGTLMNAELTEEQKNLVIGYDASLFKGAIPADSGKLGNFAATATGFNRKSATVSFDGAFAINYYFTPSVAVNGSMEMYYWDASDYAAASAMTPDNATGKCTMTLQDNGSYWAQVDGIAAKALDETYYVAAVYTDASGNRYCTGVVAYSLSRYCLNNAKDGKDMQELAANTAMYGYYANLYFTN